jgi:hypothetical protein
MLALFCGGCVGNEKGVNAVVFFVRVLIFVTNIHIS